MSPTHEYSIVTGIALHSPRTDPPAMIARARHYGFWADFGSANDVAGIGFGFRKFTRIRLLKGDCRVVIWLDEETDEQPLLYLINDIAKSGGGESICLAEEK